MKKTILLTAAIWLLAALSNAQIGGKINCYAGGGLNMPLDELKTSHKTGYHGSAGVGFNITPGLELVARYAYYSFPDRDTVEIRSFIFQQGDFDLHEIGIDIRANLVPPFEYRLRPYALISVGMASMPQEDNFFYGVGFGFKVTALPQINFFIEARYTRVMADDDDIGYIPISMGVNVSL